MRLLLILALTAAFGMLLSALLMPVAAPVEAETAPVPMPTGGRYPDNAPIRGCQHTHRMYQLLYPGPNASTCLQCGKRFAPGE